MSSLLKVPYLPVQRQFPNTDIRELAGQMDRVYRDIASKVNERTIGVYGLNNQVITGESWFLTATRQQALREVYTFTAVGSIPHGINVSTVTYFTNDTYGDFTDGTNSYGAIYASNTPIAGQVSFYITPTNIVIQAGAGAPIIVSGVIVLTWISQV